MVADSSSAYPTGPAGQPGGDSQLRSCVDELYGSSLCALAHPDPARGYQAVAQLSGHLTAMRRAVFPVAGRQPATGTWLVAACQTGNRHTQRALRRFECLLSGQSYAVRLPAGSVRTELEQRLTDYRAAEQVMLGRLGGCLTGPEHGRLTAAYRAAFLKAPTRPHPRCPHTGPLAGTLLRACALRDRALDTMDSRPGRPAG